MCKCRPQVRTPFCGKGDCVWPGSKPDGARTAMTLTEAREIIDYCDDRHMDFFNCRHSEADFKEAKGFLEGHKAALESVLKIIDDVCFIGNALDTYAERVQDETGTTIKERIEKIMEAQK